MLGIDIWELAVMAAGSAFNIGFVGQIRATLQTRCVSGVSLAQWVVFVIASAVFTAFYAHLSMVGMFLVSLFGLLAAMLQTYLIVRFRRA